MSWRTNGTAVALRGLGRRLGINKRIASVFRTGYEVRYDELLRATIRPGDCVWDVGANIGFYTKLFAECVGESGMVLAFEPSSINFERLSRNCRLLNNASLKQLGLSDSDGQLNFAQGQDEIGSTSRISSLSGASAIAVRVADNIVQSGDAPLPNIVKIDVEGHELNVLLGMTEILSMATTRAVGIEVHFSLLEAEGMATAPASIEGLLATSGFKISWPDSSHILATR